MSDLTAFWEPGMLVRHEAQPDWGVGQVQSNIDGRVTVTFQEVGKIVLAGAEVRLMPVFNSEE